MKYIKKLSEIGMDDIHTVGGKNATLGQLTQDFKDRSLIKVPDGFAITVDAYWDFIQENNMVSEIAQALMLLEQSYYQPAVLQKTGLYIRELIQKGQISDVLYQEIIQAYEHLCNTNSEDSMSVAVRSSATAEDLPGASFAGQQDSFLHVRGVQEIIQSYKECIASLFTDRALLYRKEKGFDHLSVGISVGVQQMIYADKAAAGVMFTVEPESGFKDVIVINAVHGLGEALVQGAVTPDEYHVFKPFVMSDKRPIIKKSKNEENKKFVLCDDYILELAVIAVTLETYYNQSGGQRFFLDIEWAQDPHTLQFFIVQVRPETIHSVHGLNQQRVSYDVRKRSDQRCLVTGHAIGHKAVVGKIRCIEKYSPDVRVNSDEIIVTRMTDPDWIPLLRHAKGVITELGGRTCHAAIVSRELGIPAIVGACRALHVLENGTYVTLDCTQGSLGYVYEGECDISQQVHMLDVKNSLPVLLGLIMADPDQAYVHARLPVDEVGLVRLEFIITHMIQAHPMALLYPEKIDDIDLRTEIAQLSYGYEGGADFFMKKLAEGISTIAAAFYPRPVLVRFSDFKSNEYRNLLGGSYCELHEENPMLGLRGASRYYNASYAPAFVYECKAIEYVRNVMGFDNVNVMVPFVRTVEEAKKVKSLLQTYGLISQENGLQIFMMCELPSNVILFEQFAQIFDGFSIGSNDLTQTVLAVDRDSGELASLFQEENEAVLWMIQEAIVKAKRCGKKIGICGQGPSDNPVFAEFLVRCGINSISLNVDSIISFIENSHLLHERVYQQERVRNI